MEPSRQQDRRRAGALAWTLLAVFVVLVLASAVDTLVRGGGLVSLGVVVMSTTFGVTGALAVARHRAGALGWLLIAIALSSAATLAVETWIEVPTRPGRPWVAWTGAWLWTVWTSLVAIFLPLLFPTGYLHSPRWKAAAWLGCVALALRLVTTALAPGALDNLVTPVVNPVGLVGAPARVVEVGVDAAAVVWALSILVSAASLVARFRVSAGVERQQLTWVALASVLIGVGGLGVLLGSRLSTEPNGGLVEGLGWMSYAVGLWGAMPVAVAIAVLRHRLFDVDVVVNRTLVYGLLSLTLLAAYVGSVLVLQLVLDPLTGGSDLTVAMSTLVVAGLFRPLRSRVQRVVDRRFYRRRYDAQETVRAFAVALRSELDLAAVGEDLRAVVTDTVQPLHATLWLRGTP